jgi:hypothetical protein
MSTHLHKLPWIVMAIPAFAAMPLGAARAEAITKEQCVEAHGRGQDARESGQLSKARKLLLSCAQSTCPTLIQADCSRFVEELDRLQPTVSFAARDAAQADLPDTSVYVDGVLVATRLADGKSYELDPGPHKCVFVHGEKELASNIVVNQGEKGRAIVVTFPGEGSKAKHSSAADPPAPSKPAAPIVIAVLGGAGIIGGAVVAGLGVAKVPSSCSLSSKECAAAPGDPAFTQASNGVKMLDTGIVIGAVSLATLGAGLLWYSLSSPSAPRSRETASAPNRRSVAPWVGPGAGGLAFSGSL